jgi:multiple sugar transport system permease protein
MSNTAGTMPEPVAAKRAARSFQVRLHTREAIVAYLFLAPFIIFFTIFVVRAVVTAVGMSFYDWQVLRPNRPYIGLGNLSDYVWWISLKNTIIFAIMTVAGTTVVALLSAVAVTQPIKGKSFFRVLLYMPTLLSVGVVGLTWVWLLDTQFGVINYALTSLGIHRINWLGDENLVLVSLSLTTIWWGFGFPMLIFIAPGCKPFPIRFTKPPASTAAADGRFSGTSPCRCCDRRFCLSPSPG